jgi:hypothetical protein
MMSTKNAIGQPPPGLATGCAANDNNPASSPPWTTRSAGEQEKTAKKLILVFCVCMELTGQSFRLPLRDAQCPLLGGFRSPGEMVCRTAQAFPVPFKISKVWKNGRNEQEG